MNKHLETPLDLYFFLLLEPRDWKFVMVIFVEIITIIQICSSSDLYGTDKTHQQMLIWIWQFASNWKIVTLVPWWSLLCVTKVDTGAEFCTIYVTLHAIIIILWWCHSTLCQVLPPWQHLSSQQLVWLLPYTWKTTQLQFFGFNKHLLSLRKRNPEWRGSSRKEMQDWKGITYLYTYAYPLCPLKRSQLQKRRSALFAARQALKKVNSSLWRRQLPKRRLQ